MSEKILIATSVPSASARGAGVAQTIALAIGVTATILLVGTLLARSRLGFDFTDEGYYLNSISNPWRFPVSPSQFGYIYHPLYQLLGRDVAALRQGNILISFCLAVLTCFCLLRGIGREAPTGRSWSSISSVGISIVAASSALLIVIFSGAHWLPTPSYNSLVFQSLMIASIGLCLAEANASPISVSGWILIGIGGWLAFAAKPPAAAALGVATLCSLTIAGKLNWRMLAISLLTSVLLLSALAWVVEGSVMRFFQDLYQSAFDPRLLIRQSLPGIFRFDEVELENSDLYILAFLTASILLLTWATYPGRHTWTMLGAIAILAGASISLAMTLGLPPPEIRSTKYQGVQFLAVILAALLSAAALWFRKIGWRVSRRSLALALFFAALPFIYAFGSNVNYWLVSPSAAFFWTVSAIAIVASVRPENIARRLAPLAVVTLAMTIVFVHRGMATPYRQTQPLTADADPIQLAGSSARLLVSRDVAEYINAVLRGSRDAGFETGGPMIDLSGHYPGTLYVLGAKPVGAAWMIGGYPGSDALAAKFLDRVSCEELAKSWILTEPNGIRKLSSDILKKYGIELESHYTVVAVLDSPTGTFPDSYKQQLLKPTRTQQEAVAACKLARARRG